MIIAIDYDMTIVDSSGNLIENAAEVINQLSEAGNTIIIWTSRTGESLAEALKFLQANNIAYDFVNENIPGIKNDPRKIIADVYIDDKNIGGIPDWLTIGETLKSFYFQNPVSNIQYPESSINLKSSITMENARYFFSEIRDLPADVEQSRTIEFPISTASKDRHGTVLNQGNWNLDNFNRNGIVGYQHNVYGDNMCTPPNPDDVIGKGYAFMRDGVLYGRVTFEPAEINPQSEKVFRKVLFGSLRATSVGFLPVKDEKGNEGTYGRKNERGEIVDKDTFFFYGQELLEFSIVNIPSNPDAVRKSLREQSASAIMFVNRALGGKYRFAEIENMTVRNIIDLIEGREPDVTTKFLPLAEGEYPQGEGVDSAARIIELESRIAELELDKEILKTLRG